MCGKNIGPKSLEKKLHIENEFNQWGQIENAEDGVRMATEWAVCRGAHPELRGRKHHVRVL